MAKKSRIERNKRIQKTINKYASKRSELRKIIRDKSVSLENRMQAQQNFAKLPRDSAKVRFRNRCAVTGNPRSFYSFFGVSRGALRKDLREGYLPGVVKASL